MSIYRLLPLNPNLQTNDGNASYEEFSQGVARDFPMQAATGIVPPEDTIDKVVVTWVSRDPTESGDKGMAGIFAGGLRQYGAEQIFDVLAFLTFMEEFAVDSSDGQPWTITKLDAAQLTELFTIVSGTPLPRTTQLVLDVHTTPPPPSSRSRGVPTSRSPKAQAVSQAPSGMPSSAAPRAGASSLAPSGSGASLAPAASGASSSPAGVPRSLAPRAVTVEDLQDLRVIVSSQAPRVGLVTSGAPAAAGSERSPKGQAD